VFQGRSGVTADAARIGVATGAVQYDPGSGNWSIRGGLAGNGSNGSVADPWALIWRRLTPAQQAYLATPGQAGLSGRVQKLRRQYEQAITDSLTALHSTSQSTVLESWFPEGRWFVLRRWHFSTDRNPQPAGVPSSDSDADDVPEDQAAAADPAMSASTSSGGGTARATATDTDTDVAPTATFSTVATAIATAAAAAARTAGTGGGAELTADAAAAATAADSTDARTANTRDGTAHTTAAEAAIAHQRAHTNQPDGNIGSSLLDEPQCDAPAAGRGNATTAVGSAGNAIGPAALGRAAATARNASADAAHMLVADHGTAADPSASDTNAAAGDAPLASAAGSMTETNAVGGITTANAANIDGFNCAPTATMTTGTAATRSAGTEEACTNAANNDAADGWSTPRRNRRRGITQVPQSNAVAALSRSPLQPSPNPFGVLADIFRHDVMHTTADTNPARVRNCVPTEGSMGPR